MIVDISTLLKNIDIDIDKAFLKNIGIDIDKEILENIDIDKEILENIDIDIDKDILENIDIVIDIDKRVIKIPIKNGAKWVQNPIIFAHFQPIWVFFPLFC